MSTVIFLDVDGVLNNYNLHKRKKLSKIYYKSGCKDKYDPFNPYPKKVLRLTKLIKKYNLDVYTFSAWSVKDLQPHLPFKLSGDTGKWASKVEEAMKDYDKCILIEDEASWGIYGHERKAIPNNLQVLNVDGKYGLVLKDFTKLERLLSD